MAGAFEGIRIIDLTHAMAGPMATMILADQGADVIKIEPPGTGDMGRRMGNGPGGIPPMFATSNRNKRSMVVNLRDPRGVELARRLASGADVFVHNFRPGTAERMGLGEAVLRAVRPDLIYVSISGFGESGPYSHKRAYDPIVQALSGLADIQADRDTGRPRMVRLIVVDKLTGLTGAQAIAAALFARERTGVGQHVRLSMLDAMIAFLWPEGMVEYTYPDHPAFGIRPPGAPDLVFETADGYVTVAANTDAEWRGLASALEHPEWIDDPRFRTPQLRFHNNKVRLEMTGAVLRTKNSAHWLERLEANDVPSAPVLRREAMMRDPQVVANEIIVEAVRPDGVRIRQTRPPARFDRTPAAIRRQAPRMGEHTEEVLREAGLSPAEIAELRAAGVVA